MASRFDSRTQCRLIALSAAILFSGPLCAQGLVFRPGGPPLPPQRPANLAQKSTPTQIAPPAPAAPAPKAVATADDDFTPAALPAAPRARMHECGLEWQKLKNSGAAATMLWRDFAAACLTR